MTAPIDSMRWEILSIGVQDWEYFHMLDELARSAAAKGKHPDTVKEAQCLLTVPDEICKDLTHYTQDPKLLGRHREKLAHAIAEIVEMIPAGKQNITIPPEGYGTDAAL
ncbi:MAG: hypothetical protein WCK47_00515 [bacterium]|nr:hypothetical protein [Candidatus Sumerlaeota bacterium]